MTVDLASRRDGGRARRAALHLSVGLGLTQSCIRLIYGIISGPQREGVEDKRELGKEEKKQTDLPQSVTTPPSSFIVAHLQVNPIRTLFPNTPPDTHVTHNTVKLR